ncbi:MAG: hypothetical protein EPO26_15630 [Chloroflexota bacterium]|nr:MAG: hypothetical protein EPO26_15630 [Chloroflexota bacterium]
MLFNNEHLPLPASITFVAGKNHVTVFADGLYVGGSSVDVPMGDPQPGSRPRMTSEDPRWITTLRRMYASAQRLIA